MAKGLQSFVAAEQPDLLCLQETKIDHGRVTEKEHLDGYTLLLSPAAKAGYSGVATYVRNDSPVSQPKSIAYGTGDKRFDSEGRFLITQHRDFTLYNTYFPSGTTGELRQKFKYKFLDFLFEHLQKLSAKDRGRVIVCGDFNICHKPIDIHHPEVAEKRELSGFLLPERQWMDTFAELGFIDSFRHIHGDVSGQYSWWTFRAQARQKNLGWRIDYFFVGKALAPLIANAALLTAVRGSDHCPVTLELSIA